MGIRHKSWIYVPQVEECITEHTVSYSVDKLLHVLLHGETESFCNSYL